jgi:hypothetical protein
MFCIISFGVGGFGFGFGGHFHGKVRLRPYVGGLACGWTKQVTNTLFSESNHLRRRAFRPNWRKNTVGQPVSRERVLISFPRGRCI